MVDEAELLKSLGAKIDGNRENLKAAWCEREWQPRICRVPNELSDLRMSAYRPRAVCIGPLHRAEAGPEFEAMEVTKLEYMLRLFARLQNQGFQECVADMLQNEEKARRCYAQPFQHVAHSEARQPQPKSSSKQVRSEVNPEINCLSGVEELKSAGVEEELNPQIECLSGVEECVWAVDEELNPQIECLSGVEILGVEQELNPQTECLWDVEELNPQTECLWDVVGAACEYVEPSTAAAVQLEKNILIEDRPRPAKAVEADEKTLNDILHYIQEATGGVDMGFQQSAQRCMSDKVKFAETMLIDGCFIIELVYSRYKSRPSDPILSDNFKFSAVKHDLLLLGNQIPFFVLQNLFDETLGKIQGEVPPSLPSLILSFFKGTIQAITGEDEAAPNLKKVHHILHLLHQHHLPMPSASNPSANMDMSRNCDCILQICCAKGEQDRPTGNDKADSTSSTNTSANTEKSRNCECILQIRCAKGEQDQTTVEGGLKYSATELDLAGVKFVADSKNNLFRLQFNTLSCLSFCRRGRFEIPPFSINDCTDTLLRNLIAMEQCFPNLENYFTSHAFLLDKLINSPEDVQLLEKAGIIHNYLGSPEEVANLFNTICKNVNIHPFKFQELCVQLNHYCNSCLPRSLAKLRRDYFVSPWSGISFIAAIILFLLTLLQTIYTMLSFY